MASQKSKASQKITSDLPSIPDKIYFPIGEVARLCELKPHVLRYWEQEFSQLKPVKRRGNRRYYQKKDVDLVRQIRDLLYLRGFTIEGARQQLDIRPGKTVPESPAVVSQSPSSISAAVSETGARATKKPVDSAIANLEALLEEIGV